MISFKIKPCEFLFFSFKYPPQLNCTYGKYYRPHLFEVGQLQNAHKVLRRKDTKRPEDRMSQLQPWYQWYSLKFSTSSFFIPNDIYVFGPRFFILTSQDHFHYPDDLESCNRAIITPFCANQPAGAEMARQRLTLRATRPTSACQRFRSRS